MPKGWKYESGRHALAARGIKTVDHFSKEKRVTSNDSVSMNQVSGNVFMHISGRTFEISGPAYIALNISTQRHVHDEINDSTMGDTLEHIYQMAHMDKSYSHNTKMLAVEILSRVLEDQNNGTHKLDDWIYELVTKHNPDLKHIKKDWIIIHMWNALAEGVYNLPKGWSYEVIDYDEEVPRGSKLSKLPPKTVRLFVYQGILEDVKGLPKGKSYVEVIQDE